VTNAQQRKATLIPLALAAVLPVVPNAARATAQDGSRGPFVFVCQGAPPTKLTATFLGPNADRAKLVYKGKTVIAKQTLSADGARYQAPGVDFWNKGDDATVEWRGKSLNC
jgi:membrane-bound inhibitor of C-type lysozyme